jgi:hypothetical protein
MQGAAVMAAWRARWDEKPHRAVVIDIQAEGGYG